MERKIKLWIIDVDGTLTDGGIYYDENGNELKKFCTKDAVGFFTLHELGVKTMVLTGRECKATERRMKELKVDFIVQNVCHKFSYIESFLKNHNINWGDVGYVGDDLNDFETMSKCGYKACPNDSCKEIKKIADYISPVCGGHGAVRDIVEHFLMEENEWDKVVEIIYGMGI
jgi:3-deoxy-D-manno-octulosonate 8-phosphate phosphatase (KDO 8-P phosphatase)